MNGDRDEEKEGGGKREGEKKIRERGLCAGGRGGCWRGRENVCACVTGERQCLQAGAALDIGAVESQGQWSVDQPGGLGDSCQGRPSVPLNSVHLAQTAPGHWADESNGSLCSVFFFFFFFNGDSQLWLNTPPSALTMEHNWRDAITPPPPPRHLDCVTSVSYANRRGNWPRKGNSHFL